IIKNAATLTGQLKKRGFRIPFVGTDTHLMNIDTKSVRGKDGAWLSGDLAARILDIAGIVTNRNTIPGDKSALNPSGVRMGTLWVTQRGFQEKEIIQMADIIADVLQACEPYYQGRKLRAKIDFKVLEEAKIKVRDLAESAGIDFEPAEHGYPHFYYLDDKPTVQATSIAYEIGGERVRQFLNIGASSDVEMLDVGQSQPTRICTPGGDILGTLTCVESQCYRLTVPAEKAGLVLAWLRAISDGYVKIDADLLRKVPGPVWVRHSTQKVDELPPESANLVDASKPFFLGAPVGQGDPLPDFEWEEQEVELRRTPLYDLHVRLGGRMVPFAGWEMPVRYGSVMEEHLATRNAAGLFDVAHMGVYQAEGPDAVVFLDSVTGNDVSSLHVGESLYTHFLTPDAQVIDDLLVYRLAETKYLIVVNASNDDKDWAWLNAVREGKVKVDNVRPWVKAFGRRVVLRNLRDPKEGLDMRVNIAIQGPLSRKILLSLGVSNEDRKRVRKLKWAELCEIAAGGFELVVSRTGYTGERIAFELFVHPDRAEDLFKALLKVGQPFGLIPCGLGARDSLRTEAGLPLYGHEMGGELSLGVAEAGFGSYVKVYKPWFIGRDAYLAREAKSDGVVVRFRFDDKRVRMAHLGDPVMEARGRVIGTVTSCAADSDGYLLGQAYVQRRYAKKGTQIIIYPDASKWVVKDLLDLNYGEWVSLPESATVLRRFPK
ncbi:MAG: glycine cleavage system aminomethyltransferase GcvT, partial [Chloroflexi bacterium]|nr:glycine cleavage system aminomethyltransferase GcvT [Chloroflexota bacterium]